LYAYKTSGKTVLCILMYEDWQLCQFYFMLCTSVQGQFYIYTSTFSTVENGQE